MSFAEKNRYVGADGTVHILSRAYEALNSFELAYRNVQDKHEALVEAEETLRAAEARRYDRETELITELKAHYDGELPSVLVTSFGVLMIDAEEGVRVLNDAHYTDLYMIEQPVAEAA